MRTTITMYIRCAGICTGLFIWFALAFMMGFMTGASDVVHIHYMKSVPSYRMFPPPGLERPRPRYIPPVPQQYGGEEKIEVQYTDEDFDCLAKTIYFEAGNQSYEGKLAVGEVVLNRVRSDIFPNTICAVVKQKHQFSWYWDGKSDNVPEKAPAWSDSCAAAREVLTGKAQIYDSEVLHYHADYVNPSWAQQLEIAARIDNHIFYR